MKIKKRIIDNWSLEAKDNYQFLREKVSFLDVSACKKHIISKSLICGLVSVFIVFIGIALAFGDSNKFTNSDGDGPYSPSPDTSEDADNPNFSDKDESSKPQEPGDGYGEEISSDYELFLMEISKPLIAKELICCLGYSNDSSEKVTISSENISKIIDYFNDLEYLISDNNVESIQNLNSVLSFNDTWLKIYFDHSEFVIFEYSNQKIVYATNKIDIYADLGDYLK